MIVRFPYMAEPLLGPPTPPLSSAAGSRWRPLVPVTVQTSERASVVFGRALVDPGADDTVLPWDATELLAVSLYPATGQSLRWRGQGYALRYGQVTFELADEEGNVATWTAVAGFTRAPIRYPLLGICGCLEFFDATFRGAQRIVELQTNASFPPVPVY